MTRLHAEGVTRTTSAATRSSSSTSRRYPVAAARRAKELRASGWSLGRICDFIESEFGARPTKTTVAVWSDPKAAKARKVQTARSNARRYTGRRAFVLHGDAARFARLCALRNAGLTAGATAKVLNLDYGDALTASKVLYAQEIGRYPKDARSPQSAQEESAVDAGTTPETCLRTATIRGPKESAGAVGAAPRTAPKESSSADAE